MPPPATIIAGPSANRERNVSVSSSRKRSSPWVEKTSSIGIFTFWEMSSSVSNRRNPVCPSKIFPTRDFPVPIKPISTIDLEEATSEYVSEGTSCKEDRDLISGAPQKPLCNFPGKLTVFLKVNLYGQIEVPGVGRRRHGQRIGLGDDAPFGPTSR